MQSTTCPALYSPLHQKAMSEYLIEQQRTITPIGRRFCPAILEILDQANSSESSPQPAPLQQAALGPISGLAMPLNTALNPENILKQTSLPQEIQTSSSEIAPFSSATTDTEIAIQTVHAELLDDDQNLRQKKNISKPTKIIYRLTNKTKPLQFSHSKESSTFIHQVVQYVNSDLKHRKTKKGINRIKYIEEKIPFAIPEINRAPLSLLMRSYSYQWKKLNENVKQRHTMVVQEWFNKPNENEPDWNRFLKLACPNLLLPHTPEQINKLNQQSLTNYNEYENIKDDVMVCYALLFYIQTLFEVEEENSASALSSLNLWVGLARKLPRLSDRKSPHIDQY